MTELITGPETGPAEPSPGRARASRRPPASKAGMAALTLGALGVVFGDIGTSPLYALQTVFSEDNHLVRATEAGVYGVISLVFWSITLVVSVKYVTFIMRADNDGEGGVIALIALIRSVNLDRGRMAKAALVALGIFGASLFYGDGMITPAISVLSAVEGLKVAAPALSHVVVPVTLAILTSLFVIQRFGTAVVGRLFGPIMGVWFAVLAAAGIAQIGRDPSILKALSPSYAIAFFADHGAAAFAALAGVVLVMTGAEALYADMGHFGRRPISRAWFFVVFPALTLNYMGQGSLILGSPKAIDNPFFLLMPHWSRIPMVVLATVATVIASQAVISGAFSLTRQAVQLGFLPRMSVRHTSHEEVGQVYAPAINWLIFIAVAALVLGFGSSAKLASAYGVAVTGTFITSTILFLVVVRTRWRKPLWLVLLGALVFLTIDVAFFAANLRKVPHGGWFPLTIALLVFVVLMTWQRGREIVTRNRTDEEGPLRDFVEHLHAMDVPVNRPDGTAVFLNANPETTPLALRANVEHNHCLHRCVVILSLQTENVPHVPPEERIAADDLGYRDDGITHVIARFGFQDDPNVPQALRLACDHGLEGHVDVEHASYFLSKIDIFRGPRRGMRPWRKKLFIGLSRLASNPAEYFCLPPERTVIMGGHIEL